MDLRFYCCQNNQLVPVKTMRVSNDNMICVVANKRVFQFVRGTSVQKIKRKVNFTFGGTKGGVLFYGTGEDSYICVETFFGRGVPFCQRRNNYVYRNRFEIVALTK